MGDEIMARAPDIEWWRKLTVRAEFGHQLGPGAIYPARKWLFDSEGALVRQYKGYRVFWLRGWVRILGLEAGAGVFWRGTAIVDGRPKGRDSLSGSGSADQRGDARSAAIAQPLPQPLSEG